LRESGLSPVAIPWKVLTRVCDRLAEFERSLIRERTSEGRERARKVGRRLGRPPKLTPYQRETALRLRGEGQDNAEIARVLGSPVRPFQELLESIMQ
jgi:DNA invertase Pin-like site-specific DNA recombinase